MLIGNVHQSDTEQWDGSDSVSVCVFVHVKHRTSQVPLRLELTVKKQLTSNSWLFLTL